MSKKITELPAASGVTSDDLVPIVDLADTTTKKSTFSQIFTFIKGLLLPSANNNDVAGFDGAGSLKNLGPAVVVPAGVVNDVVGLDGAGQLKNLGAMSGEANTAANVGAGAGQIFRDKTGVTINLKTLLAGSNITLTNNANDVTIAASGGSGEVNTASNLGVTTYGLYKTKVGADLQFKSLTAGTGVVLTSNTNDVAIGLSVPVSIGNGGTGVSSLPGANTYIFFNDSGAFGADADLTWDKTNNVLSVATAIAVGGGTVHTTAKIRTAYPGGAQVVIIGRKDNSNVDQIFLADGPGNVLQVGYNGANLNIYGNDVLVAGNATTSVNANSQRIFDSGGTTFNLSLPLQGNATFSKTLKLQSVTVSMTSAGTDVDISGTPATYACPFLKLTGTYASSQNLILPDVADSVYFVHNGSSGARVCKKSGGSGVSIAAAAASWIIHNGTDYVKAT